MRFFVLFCSLGMSVALLFPQYKQERLSSCVCVPVFLARTRKSFCKGFGTLWCKLSGRGLQISHAGHGRSQNG